MADLRRLRSETITRLDSFFPKWVVMGGLVTHITYTCLSPVMGVYRARKTCKGNESVFESLSLRKINMSRLKDIHIQ